MRAFRGHGASINRNQITGTPRTPRLPAWRYLAVLRTTCLQHRTRAHAQSVCCWPVALDCLYCRDAWILPL